MQECIELVFLFEGPKLDTLGVIKYFGSIHESLFKSTFQEISYSVPVKSHLRGKSLKFTSKNIEKLISENPSRDYELFSLLPGWKYKSQDISFAVLYTPKFNKETSLLDITIDKETFYDGFDNGKIVEIYLGVANYLKANKVEIKYGFVFSIDSRKFPGLFVRGIGNNVSSKKEIAEMRIWAEKNSESGFKIWRVFWGNLITNNHLRPGIAMNNIKKIVGENNFITVDPATCFFNLPNNDLLYGNEHKSSVKLTNLLNALTKPDPKHESWLKRLIDFRL